MKENLSYLEAFHCMRNFLEIYYENTHSKDVAGILSDTQIPFWEGGGTADPAAWDDWMDSVQKVRDQSKKEVK